MDLQTFTRRYLLYPGIVMAWVGWLFYIIAEFDPSWLNEVSVEMFSSAQIILPSNLTPIEWMGQGLNFTSSLLMMCAPLAAKPKQWPNFVIALSVAISCSFPVINELFDLSWKEEFVARLTCTYAAIALFAALGRIPWSTLIRIVSIRFWWQVLRGDHGPDHASVLGIEFLGWGFAIMDRNPLLATGIALFGSVYLIRFAQLAQKEKRPLATQWLWLNIVSGTLRVVKFACAFLL